MIQQIFNIISKFFSLIQYRYNTKGNLLFIALLIFISNYGYVTESRIILFSFIIIGICLYKIIYKKAKEVDFAYNEKVLYIVLGIDYIKLCIINILIFISIKIYELRSYYQKNKKIKKFILIIENLTTNPIKILLYKFYNVLHIGNDTPILEIFFKRIYGSLLGVLIFSNVIGYAGYLLNYSWLHLYIILIVINLIDEMVKSGKFTDYKIYKYIEYIKYLNLNKDLFKIIEVRTEVSILVLYIQKALKKSKLGIKRNKIKRFAFIIYLYYQKQNDKIIIFKNTLKQLKLNQLRISRNQNELTYFDFYYFHLVILLEDYFELLSRIEYVNIKLKKHNEFKATFSDIELIKIKELEKFVLLVIQILLYYLGDFENMDKNNSDFNFNSLIIDADFELFHLEYKWDFSTRTKYINNSKKEIFSISNKSNKEFYEQFFLYANLLSIFYVSTVSIDFEDYSHIEAFANIILNDLKMFNDKFESFYKLDIDGERANEEDLTIKDEILEKLNEYKNLFIEEGKESQKDTLEYRNFKRLRELNEYISIQINKIK